MIVLLVEADVHYDLLKEMDDINPELSQTARNERGSPIYAMPLLATCRGVTRD